MANLSTEFSARLSSGRTTTCLCWRLTRKDGTIVGVTEHDRTLSAGDTICEPNGALNGAALTQSAGLKPGQAGASGALSSDAITEADLTAGLWDGARVDVFRVDWTAPEHAVCVWSGQFTEIRHGARGFEAELVSLKAELERPVGRVFSRRCGAVLGDAQCGVDLSDPAFAGRTCDQRLETCRDRFGNIENFRGFPHMPGNDAILAGPALSEEA